jgi:hypothetical protein
VGPTQGSHRYSPRRPASSSAPRSESRSSEFVRELELVSGAIRDPVAKLRYIRGALADYASLEGTVQLIPWGAARRVTYRHLSERALERMRRDPEAFRARAAALSPAAEQLPVRARTVPVERPAWASPVALLAVVGLVAGLAHYAVQAPGGAAEAATSTSVGSPPVSLDGPVPALPPAAPIQGVWLVESGRGFEQYSNGLRLDTSMQTGGDPRSYHIFSVEHGIAESPSSLPVGILYHTSESDIWPMAEAYNENLRDSSHRLLRYIQRNRLYHFVIDRFGRVFRVVQEQAKANHAGHSIWADEGIAYLNMNHSFLAVCFETRWEGGHALPITQAQLAGARALTGYLQHRYQIPSRMCVTHGIASVNPAKYLIGHHLDWARGFPFEAMGLPDAYEVPAPSVALFGFDYDDDFLKVMGQPWDGVVSAERILRDEAARANKTLEEVRQDRRQLYERWREEQKAADDRIATRAADVRPGSKEGG